MAYKESADFDMWTSINIYRYHLGSLPFGILSSGGDENPHRSAFDKSMVKIQQILICCQKDVVSCYIFGFLLVAKNFKLQSLLLSVLVGWLLVAKIPPHVVIGFHCPPVCKVVYSSFLNGTFVIRRAYQCTYILTCANTWIGSHEDNKLEAK